MKYQVLSIKLKMFLRNTYYIIPNTGFTLIEILITTSILAIAGGLLAQVVIQNNGLFYQQSTKISQGLGINSTKTILVNDLRSATAIVPAYPVATPTYSSSEITLILQVPSVNGAGNIIDNTYDYIVYFKDPNKPNLFIKKYFPDVASSKPSQNQVLLTELSYLQFNYLDSSGIAVSPQLASRVNFTIKANTQVGLDQQETSSSGDVNLRNN